MSVYFAFSDESGKYKRERSDKFISKNPFYCRSVVLLQAEEWREMRENFYGLKKNFLRIDTHQEIKWSYIWSLYKHFQKKEPIPSTKPYSTLQSIPLDTLVDFIHQTLQLLRDSSSCRILLTLTFNSRDKTQPLGMKEILKGHFTHILDSIEREIGRAAQSTGVLFLSPEEPRVESQIRKALAEIYGAGPSLRYPHLKSSFNFEVSLQSFGSQLADYCAGLFNGCCRFYPQSIDLFRHQLWPKVLKKNGEALGWGITEIPKNPLNRKHLDKILKKVFQTPESDYRVLIKDRLKSKKGK